MHIVLKFIIKNKTFVVLVSNLLNEIYYSSIISFLMF